jgi:hypothetical protein
MECSLVTTETIGTVSRDVEQSIAFVKLFTGRTKTYRTKGLDPYSTL